MQYYTGELGMIIFHAINVETVHVVQSIMFKNESIVADLFHFYLSLFSSSHEATTSSTFMHYGGNCESRDGYNH